MPRYKTSREELLTTAAAIFAQKGYHDTTVTDIQEAARIGRGTFYLYFRSKRDIFAALLNPVYITIELILSIPEKAIVDMAKQNILLANYQLFTISFNNLLKNRDMVKILLQEAMVTDAGFRDQLNLYTNRLIDHVAQVIQLLINEQYIRPIDTQLAAITFIGSLKEIITYLVSTDKIVDTALLARQYHNIFFHGLAGPKLKDLFIDETGVPLPK